MVYSWNEYLKEKPHKNPGLRKYLFSLIVIIVIVFLYMLVILLIHPWTDFTPRLSSSQGEPTLDFIFTNIGSMRDTNMVIELTAPSECEASFPNQCTSDVNKIECKEFFPGDTATLSCKTGSIIEAYSIHATTRYQVIIGEYICNVEGCGERQTRVQGSSPAYWNYISMYPLDLISQLTGLT
jgi:hypothetical protein